MTFLDNISISRKLIGSILILAVFIGIVAGIRYVNMKSINDDMTTMHYHESGSHLHLKPLFSHIQDGPGVSRENETI